ncbi:MAG: hypothetical protein ACE5G5_09880 [Candidatus Methylomirabilales bacterium]
MKDVGPGDPMELVGVGLPEGDPDYMAECLVEEFMLLGWNERQLMTLFTRPFFQTTHRIYREKGEDCVRALIQRVRDKWRPASMREGTSNA